MTLLTCSHCEYTTKRRWNYERHMRTMHGETETANVGIHQNVAEIHQNVAEIHQNVAEIHQNVAEIHQNVADFAGNVPEELRPFTCEKCAKTFKMKHHVQKHQHTCEGINNPLQCPKCLFVCANRFAKSRHVKSCTFAPSPQPTTATTINNIHNNIQNTTNNTTNNNNTLIVNHNYYIRNFGEEDVAFLTKEMVYKFLMQKNGYGIYNCFEAIHFSKEQPQNCNIRLADKPKLLQVHMDGRWISQPAEEVLEKGLNNSREVMMQFSQDPEFKHKVCPVPSDRPEDTMYQYTTIQRLIDHHIEFCRQRNSNDFYMFLRKLQAFLEYEQSLMLQES
jgi:hypothetical protein